MRLIVKNSIIKASLFALCLLVSACGEGSKSSSSDDANPEINKNISSIEELNESFKSITDEYSALQAISDFETYVNKKAKSSLSLQDNTQLGVFSFSESLKEKLAQEEASSRKFEFEIENSGKISLAQIISDDDTDILDLSDYLREKEEAMGKGLSSQDLATIFNEVVANTHSETSAAISLLSGIGALEMTATKVELLKEGTADMLPGLNPNKNGRINPLEALVLGYVATSDDDGEKEDGDVSTYATQAQLNDFVDRIVSE